MKAKAIAPANIAFIKYWGRKDDAAHIPANPSISMNLSNCLTTTTVEFSDEYPQDSVVGTQPKRVIEHIDRIRSLAKRSERASITTENNFPASAGIASSASGFAALTVAAAAALNLRLSERELSVLARLGSGSAARSIPDGFVKWDGEFARSLYPADWWDLRDVIVVVAGGAKKTPSSLGHEKAATSPLFAKRLAEIPDRIKRIEKALKEKNFEELGAVIEEDCLSMHAVMATQHPPLRYWTDETRQVIDIVKKLPAHFTVDAGPNVHVICEGKHEADVVRALQKYTIIVNRPAQGAHLI